MFRVSDECVALTGPDPSDAAVTSEAKVQRHCFQANWSRDLFFLDVLKMKELFGEILHTLKWPLLSDVFSP